jgi:hypothetical protein
MEPPPKLTSFTLFPDLPTEIRLKIWGLLAPGPRTVIVQYNTKYNEFNGKRISTFTGWTSPDPPPVILSICREARSEALKSYQPALGSYFHHPKIYVDFSNDTLRLESGPKDWEPTGDLDEGTSTERPSTAVPYSEAGPSDYLLDIFLGGGYHGADDAEKIQHMIIDINEDLYGRRNFCWEEIRQFIALKGLTLIAWEADAVADQMMDHFKETLTAVARAHPEWAVPQVKVKNAPTGTEWGTVKALASSPVS